MNVFDLVQVYESIQSSGKTIEHSLADDQFKHLSRHFMFKVTDKYHLQFFFFVYTF